MVKTTTRTMTKARKTITKGTATTVIATRAISTRTRMMTVISTLKTFHIVSELPSRSLAALAVLLQEREATVLHTAGPTIALVKGTEDVWEPNLTSGGCAVRMIVLRVIVSMEHLMEGLQLRAIAQAKHLQRLLSGTMMLRVALP
jgi:hypothetical protein